MKEKSRHYAVKELADLAGISRRTLHYYDRIGLLKPSERGSNRYRYYDKDSLLYLQQILFYRELGMNLTEIKDIIRQSDFDVIQALHSHKTALLRRVERLNELIDTVGKTIIHLTGGNKMRKKDIFKGFSEEEQEKYAEEAREKYDSRLVDESMKRWKSYSPEKQKEIMKEGSAIYQEIFDHMNKGADSPEVQTALAKWHQNLRYFYEPTPAMLRGLGQMYKDSPDFRSKFEQYSPEFPVFLYKAIQLYYRNQEKS